MRLGLALIVLMTFIMSVVHSQRLHYHRPMRPGYNMMSGIMQVYGSSYPRKFLIVGSPKGPKMIRMKRPAAISYSNIKKPKTTQKSPKVKITEWPKTTEKPRKYRKLISFLEFALS